MPSDVLPGYGWNKDTGRYRDLNSGRFVSRQAINELLITQIQSAESRLGALSTSFHEGKIAPSVWVEQMRTEVRRLAIQQIALVKGGFSQIDNRDFIKADTLLRDVHIRITITAQDMIDGKVSLPQLLNRVSGYIGETRRLYWQTWLENARASSFDNVLIAKRTLGSSEHCEDCLAYYQLGYALIEDAVAPGSQCQCGPRCRCDLVVQEVPRNEVEQWLGTK